MDHNNTQNDVTIEFDPFDLASVTAALNVSETMIATAETTILELAKRLFVDGTPATDLCEADFIGGTLDMLRDAKMHVVAVRAGLNAAGGVS